VGNFWQNKTFIRARLRLSHAALVGENSFKQPTKLEHPMRNIISKFFRSETGAVTVDWVVLTAAIVFLGAGVAVLVRTGALDLRDRVGVALTDYQVE